MTPAKQYHERMRDLWMREARYWASMPWSSEKTIDAMRSAILTARSHNHQAIHVARLTRARMEQNAR